MGSLRTCNSLLAVTLSIQRMKQPRHREAKSFSQQHTGCALTRLQPQPPKGWDDRAVSPLGFRARTFEIPCAMGLCPGSSASPVAVPTAYPPSPEHCTHAQGAILSLRLLNKRGEPKVLFLSLSGYGVFLTRGRGREAAGVS